MLGDGFATTICRMERLSTWPRSVVCVVLTACGLVCVPAAASASEPVRDRLVWR